MKKFKVTINVSIPSHIVIEAEDEDAAVDKAEEIIHQRFMETRFLEAEETSEGVTEEE